MTEGPFTDDYLKHWRAVVQTHVGIIHYAEAMAQVLAEAGKASSKAVGDDADHAVDKWVKVIQKRAHELLADYRGNRESQEFRSFDEIGKLQASLPSPVDGKR